VSQSLRMISRAPELRLFHIELNRLVDGERVHCTTNVRACDENEARELGRERANISVVGEPFEVVRVRALE
jgi:hypothetical protein